MDTLTLIVVGDERAPMRRFNIPLVWIRRAAWIAGVLLAVLIGGGVHYGLTLHENEALAGYRVEANEQREQIKIFEQSLGKLESEISRVREFERKVRIIANLPGAAATGGENVTEVAVPTHPGQQEQILPPAGVPFLSPVPVEPKGEAVPLSQQLTPGPEIDLTLPSLQTPGVQRLQELDLIATSLGDGARLSADALGDLLDGLQDKHNRLISMPSVWPTRGWLTSRFGKRISPFTGRPHQHAGIDIAAETGTPVIAPARGLVSFVGHKGPLGQSVVINHGYGVRTVYGHNSEIHVKIGDEVVRGQLLAAVGSTGRSTGPHLHYSVEVRGVARDPLDYVFD